MFACTYSLRISQVKQNCQKIEGTNIDNIPTLIGYSEEFYCGFKVKYYKTLNVCIPFILLILPTTQNRKIEGTNVDNIATNWL